MNIETNFTKRLCTVMSAVHGIADVKLMPAILIKTLKKPKT